MKTFRISLAVIAILCMAAAAPAQTTQPTTRPSAVPAEDVLNRMLKPANQAPQPLQPIVLPPPTDKTTGTGAIAPAALPLHLIREGSFGVDRTGRLTKSADGAQSEFTFDSDGRAMQDPPLVIVPNLKLEQMEQAVNQSNRDLKFRVTGMLTEYHGRNYVLLEKVVVIPEVVQQF